MSVALIYRNALGEIVQPNPGAVAARVTDEHGDWVQLEYDAVRQEWIVSDETDRHLFKLRR